jgi:O-antigen/teichoic acid export membrane protein
MSEPSKAAIDQIPHLEDLSTMVRGTSVALVGGFLGSVLGWVSQLSLARLLGPEGFGSYSIGMAIIGIASQISTIGLASATIYFVARYAREDPGKARDVLLQSIGASLVTGLVAGFVLFLLSPLIATQFLHREELAPALRIFALAIGFAASFKVASAAITVSYRLSYRVYLDLFSNGVFLLFFLVFYLLGGRVGGVAIAFFLSTVLGFVASAYALVRLFPDSIASSSPRSWMLYDLLAYSMPAFGASCFGFRAVLWTGSCSATFAPRRRSAYIKRPRNRYRHCMWPLLR